MKPIPKPERYSTHIEETDAAALSEGIGSKHAIPELRLLLDVLKKAARDTEKIDSNDYTIGIIAAVDAIRVLAPHLIDAAKQEPK